MAKLKLDLEYEFDFALLGLSCPLPDYRLAHYVNKVLDLDLIRIQDIDVHQKKADGDKYFSLFQDDDEELYTTINLISNRSQNGYFIPELKQLDYFLQLWLPEIDENLVEEYRLKLNGNSHIATCIPIDVEQLKSKNNFLF